MGRRPVTYVMSNLNSPKNWWQLDASRKGSASWQAHYLILWMTVCCFLFALMHFSRAWASNVDDFDHFIVCIATGKPVFSQKSTLSLCQRSMLDDGCPDANCNFYRCLSIRHWLTFVFRQWCEKCIHSSLFVKNLAVWMEDGRIIFGWFVRVRMCLNTCVCKQ